MAQYDISSKVLFADYERDFIALTLGTQDFEILGTIPTEFPSVQMRMTDAPMRVRLSDGREVIVHIEFQTGTSGDPMEFRIAEYIGGLIHEYQLPVYVTVIYLAPSAGRNAPGGYVYNFEDTFSYALRYQVIRMEEIDGEEILDQQSPIGLIPFAGLMKRPQSVSNEEWLDKCIQTVLEIPLESEEKQRDYFASFCVLSRLVYADDLIQKVLKEKRMILDIEDSPFIKMYTDKARAEGRIEGFQEGERDAQQRAEVDAYANALLRVIERVFGLRGREELEPCIRAITDGQKLVSLIDLALQSPSIDEFKRSGLS